MKQQYNCGGFRDVKFLGKGAWKGLLMRAWIFSEACSFRAGSRRAILAGRGGRHGRRRAIHARARASRDLLRISSRFSASAAMIAGELARRQGQQPSPGPKGQEIRNLRRERHLMPADGRTALKGCYEEAARDLRRITLRAVLWLYTRSESGLLIGRML